MLELVGHIFKRIKKSWFVLALGIKKSWFVLASKQLHTQGITDATPKLLLSKTSPHEIMFASIGTCLAIRLKSHVRITWLLHFQNNQEVLLTLFGIETNRCAVGGITLSIKLLLQSL